MEIRTSHSAEAIQVFRRLVSLGDWAVALGFTALPINKFCHISWKPNSNDHLYMAIQFADFDQYVPNVNSKNITVHMFELETHPDLPSVMCGFFTKHDESPVLAIREVMKRFIDKVV
jgi:hypothetical protein